MKEYRVFIKNSDEKINLEKIFTIKKEAITFYEKASLNNGDVIYLFGMNPITILKARGYKK